MCADRRGVGYSVGRKLAQKGYDKERLPQFDRIPSSKLQVLPLIFRFALAGRSVAVFTEALGAQRHHGQRRAAGQRALRERGGDGGGFRIRVQLATLVGTKTAGRLVATSAFKVGFGYRLVIPVAAYYTWSGTNMEGRGVLPTIEADFSVEALWNGEDLQLKRAIEALEIGSVPAYHSLKVQSPEHLDRTDAAEAGGNICWS